MWTPKEAWARARSSNLVLLPQSLNQTSGSNDDNNDLTPAHKQLLQRSQYQDLVSTSNGVTISNLQKDNLILTRYLDASRARVNELENKLECMSDYNEFRLKSLLGFAKGLEAGINQVRKFRNVSPFTIILNSLQTTSMRNGHLNLVLH